MSLCHGNQQKGASATEYDKLATLGAAGLGDLSSPNRNTVLLSPARTGGSSAVCQQYKHLQEPAQGPFRGAGVQNTDTAAGQAGTSLGKKMGKS